MLRASGSFKLDYSLDQHLRGHRVHPQARQAPRGRLDHRPVTRTREDVEGAREARLGRQPVLARLHAAAIRMRTGQHGIVEQPVRVGLRLPALGEGQDLALEKLGEGVAHVARIAGIRQILGDRLDGSEPLQVIA